MNKSEKLSISIVIPTYNRKDYVQIAIDSVLKNKNENLFNLNIVIIDDGSTDGTEIALHKYNQNSEVHYFKIQNSERGFARNYGAKFAIDELKADYILFFDADDIMNENALNTFYKNIATNPQVKCFFGQCQILEKNNKLDYITPQIMWPMNAKKHVIEKGPLLPLGCTIIHATVFKDIQGFNDDRSLSGSEDWLFLFQVVLKYEVMFLPYVITYYRVHDGNTNAEKLEQSNAILFKIIQDKKNKLNLTDLEVHFLDIQLLYGQVGANNRTNHQRALHFLMRIFLKDKMQIFKIKFYYYFLSILKRFILSFTQKIKYKLRRRELWGISIYSLQNENDIFNIDSHKPSYFFSEKGVRTNTKYQSTITDPFLFTHKEQLYLFYEVQTDFGVGEIWAKSLTIGEDWQDHGPVLKEPFHLSYPMVFHDKNEIYMIPESSEVGQVWLYKAKDFPTKWEKHKLLMNEALVDVSLIQKENGIFLLGTTKNYELKLYFACDFEQDFIQAKSFITNDKAVSRNGGKPITIDGKIYRIAQNCKNSYGEKIGLLQITDLSFDNYKEEIVISDLYKQKQDWMQLGYHHLSMAKFKNKNFVAVDGMRKDYFLNTMTLAFLRIFNRQKI